MRGVSCGTPFRCGRVDVRVGKQLVHRRVRSRARFRFTSSDIGVGVGDHPYPSRGVPCPTSSYRCSTKPPRSRACSRRFPADWNADRRRQRLDGRLGRRRRASAARSSSASPGAGSARRASPGSAPPSPTSCASWTATARSTAAICRASRTGRRRHARPRARRARRPTPGAWPLHARVANRCSAPRCAAAPACRSPTSDRCARARRDGAARGSHLRDRRFGWPLEMVLRAARRPAGRSRRSPWRLPPAHRALEGDRHRRGARSGRSATCRRRCDDERPSSSSPRRPTRGGSRRACARRARRTRPRDSPRPRSRTRSAAVAGDAVRRRVLVLDGPTRSVAPGRLRGDRPARPAGSTTGSPAPSRTSDGPAVLVGMDTPQITATLVDAHARRAARAGRATRCSAPRSTAATGRVGLDAEPGRSFLGVPMSTTHTFRAQRRAVRRARAARRACCRGSATSTTTPTPSRSRSTRRDSRFAAVPPRTSTSPRRS